MNIHEHQAKEILRQFEILTPKGVVIFNLNEINKKTQNLESPNLVVKAQIHAGGRGKGGGIKLVKSKEELIKEVKKMFGMKLVTHQTGSAGRTVKRIYIEETCKVAKEYYLSCLVDRASSKIAFISSAEGGVDIEEVAKKKPKKITTTKINLSKSVNEEYINKIIKPFSLPKKMEKQAHDLIKSIYKILIEKDASLIEINPLVLTKENDIICLDAKITFDDNALYKHPEILSLRDINEEEPAEIEASKNDLAYIKLDGSIGCMVNGAGLAMATMDIIKLHGKEPANFLDVGGGASKEQVAAAFKIILSDKNVKGILINIFGGIMRCDVLAKGVVEAVRKTKLNVPLVVRLAGTNYKEGKKILDESNLKILSAADLNDAAIKIVKAVE